MKRTILLATLVAFGFSLIFPVALALAQADSDQQLRRDIEKLKQDQEVMRKDLDEIKKLLQARQAPLAPPPVQAIDTVLELGDAPLKGNQDAKLTLIEFSDYQCPFCKRYQQATLPSLDKEYVDAGKIRYVFQDFPLESIHPQAFKAAEAAHCAGDQGKYWEMHDKLFANQQMLQPDKLIDYAQAIGLKMDTFQSCLDSDKYAEAIRKNIAEGEKLGVTGTPTFFLGVSDGGQVKQIKRIRGSQPYSFFKQEIDALLAEKP